MALYSTGAYRGESSHPVQIQAARVGDISYTLAKYPPPLNPEALQVTLQLPENLTVSYQDKSG